MGNILNPADRGLTTRLVFFGLLLVIFLIPLSGRAQDDDRGGKEVFCSWEPPTYGTPVHHYVLQVVEFGGAQPDTTIQSNIPGLSWPVSVEYGNTYKARVAAVDAEGHQGPWSNWTNLYGPEFPYDQPANKDE